MAHEKLLEQVQFHLNRGEMDEAVDVLFASYLETHPTAQNIKTYRDRVSYKLQNEFGNLPETEAKAKSKLLIYGFISIISNSEGETGYNIVLLLLHLMRRGHHEAIREIIEVIKLERASRQLGKK